MLSPEIFPDHESLSRHAAAWLQSRVEQKPGAIFCLASGATPMLTYTSWAEKLLANRHQSSEMRVLKLDEWGGIDLRNPATCDRHLRSALVDPLNLGDRYVGFESEPLDPEAECDRIAQWLSTHGPIDVCVLGLGLNGHLGFNEPAEFLHPHAHVARLSTTSLSHSMLKQSSIQPTYGLTLGIADVMQAREVLLLVSGVSKREPLQRLLSDRITTSFPASILAAHPRTTLLCDTAAYGARAGAAL